MKRALAVWAALLLAGSTAWAVDLSGEWTTQMTFASGMVSPSTAFTLNLAGSGWRLTSTWDLALPQLSSHALVLKGSLGPVGFTAGASVRLTSSAQLTPLGGRRDLAGWSVEGFEFTGGFVALELTLGSLTLRLTLQNGIGE